MIKINGITYVKRGSIDSVFQNIDNKEDDNSLIEKYEAIVYKTSNLELGERAKIISTFFSRYKVKDDE